MEANKVNIFLSDEAKAFVRSLPEKAKKKVLFNILKVEGGEMDKELFKNSMIIFGSFVHLIMACATVYWPFGIRNAEH